MSELLYGVILAGMVVFAVVMLSRNRMGKKKRPGQYLEFVAEGKTAAQCRGLLSAPGDNRVFEYRLERAKSGGQYITFTRYVPTEQILDTVYLLVFEDESPARISMTFVREVFGANEPVFGEALLEEFFQDKLGARRAGTADSQS